MDHAATQRARLERGELEGQLDYWKHLRGAPPLLELPTDAPRPAVESHRGARHAFKLDAELWGQVQALARREGTTPFAVLLAGYQVLLSRLSGQTDVCVGTPVAGRNRAGQADVIGLFVNTLAFRAELSGAPSFSALLGHVRERVLGALAHQDVPFERVVEAVQPVRSQSHAPLFQAMLVLQDDPALALELEGLRWERLEVDTGASMFDLTLFLFEGREGGLDASFEYATDLFTASTVERVAGHLRTLLRAAVTTPERSIAELPLLSAAEREQLLVTWNDTRSPEAPEANIPALVEAQTRRTPDALALIAGQERWTYSQLEARVLRLANHLRSLGVGTESRVGVCLGRSAELVVALMAVQKAGGAYVPLDPNWPRDRHALVIDDAAPGVLLTTRALAERLGAPRGQVVCLDAEAETLARASASPLPCPASPDNVSAILYTSGSTGRPKGVALTHRGAVTFLRWASRTFSPQQLSRVLFATSINFDLSVFELFAPLTCGGAVVVADDALALPSIPAANEVTLVNTVPSAMAELVRARAVPASVRTVNLAGEALPRQLVDAIYSLGSVQDVFNLYGPTEDTTYSTYARVPPDAEPTIGRPLSDTAVYLVDSRLQPVPVGVAGELYLSGEGLARGYLGRPDLTAERFVPNPFSPLPGARMYRTGDLARYLPDGRIAYLGRADFQVKVRGFRIELGEVEAALAACAGVRESVVLAREDSPGHKRLVAYVVAGEQAPSVAELRTALGERLPAYMVPSAFVVLPALPRTPNGKVDRRALPAPDATQVERTQEYVAPRTPGEKLLADLWREVLGVEQVGVHDDFFALGGHSLLATQVISRVRNTLHVDLPLALPLRAPTLALLADASSHGDDVAPVEHHEALVALV
ncbi:non-ribosomal peptide synthetase, partial [Pyxidicoccus sp. 3LG]